MCVWTFGTGVGAVSAGSWQGCPEIPAGCWQPVAGPQGGCPEPTGMCRCAQPYMGTQGCVLVVPSRDAGSPWGSPRSVWGCCAAVRSTAPRCEVLVRVCGAVWHCEQGELDGARSLTLCGVLCGSTGWMGSGAAPVGIEAGLGRFVPHSFAAGTRPCCEVLER